jgi:hypothetical protein
MLRRLVLVIFTAFGLSLAVSASTSSGAAFSVPAVDVSQVVPAQHPPPPHRPPHVRPHRPALADYGDAPESDELFFCSFAFATNYPSRFASGGPYHTDFTDVWLGPSPNTETAEPDAILPNCDDWLAPPFDVDDGCLILDIGPGSGYGWACAPPVGAIFEPPGAPPLAPGCYPAVWSFRVSVGPTAPVVPRFANVVYDNFGCNPNGTYGTPAPEWVLQNEPITAAPGGPPQTMLTGIVFVQVSNNPAGTSWGILPFWTRFTVSRTPINPLQFLPNGWNGSGPPGGFVFGETEDWLVFGDPNRPT